MKSFFQILSFDILSKGLLGLVSLLFIRYMSSEEYADFTLAKAVIIFLMQTVSPGFNRIYIIGNERIKHYRPYDILSIELLITITLLLLLSWPLTQLFGTLFAFIVAVALSSACFEFSKTILQQDLKFKHYSLVEFSRSALFSTAILLLVYEMGSDLKAWQVFALQAAAFATVFFIFLGGKINYRELFNFRSARRLTGELIQGEYRFLFGYFAVLALFFRLDVFMLKALSDDLSIATYGSAFRYYTLLTMPLAALQIVLLPIFKKVKSSSEFDQIIKQHKILLIAFIPIVIGAAWLSEWVMPLVDLGKYPEAVTVFRILAVVNVIIFAAGPALNLIMAGEDFKYLFYLMLFSLFANFALNYILIIKYGSIGAALATLLAYLLVAMGLYFKIKRKNYKPVS